MFGLLVTINLKMIKFLILFVVLTNNLISAQEKDSLLNEIRRNYSEIRAKLDSYETTKIEIRGQSAEGGWATGYYNVTEIKLIEVVLLGESGKKHIEYYFNDGELIFAFEQNFIYNQPIYINQNIDKENEKNEVFDYKKTIIEEDRYYFENEKLFLWLDNNKLKQDLTIESRFCLENRLIAHCYKLMYKLEPLTLSHYGRSQNCLFIFYWQSPVWQIRGYAQIVLPDPYRRCQILWHPWLF